MTKTILLIEDARQISAALSIRLRAAGYQVVTASNGTAGLKVALDQSLDLILLDIWLPTGSSFSVVEEMRRHGRNVPVIFLTASRKPGLWKKAQEVGSAGFIEKPIDPRKLLATIKRTLASATPTEPDAETHPSKRQPARTKEAA